MTYYKIVLSGENIFFENYSDATEPVIGFITCKLVDAETEDLAIATAKRDLLVQWNHSFNSDRKLGMPKLSVEFAEPVKGWFKPKTSHDFFWFTSQEHKHKQLQEFTRAPTRWFWRKPKTPDSPSEPTQD